MTARAALSKSKGCIDVRALAIWTWLAFVEVEALVISTIGIDLLIGAACPVLLHLVPFFAHCALAFVDAGANLAADGADWLAVVWLSGEAVRTDANSHLRLTIRFSIILLPIPSNRISIDHGMANTGATGIILLSIAVNSPSASPVLLVHIFNLRRAI